MKTPDHIPRELLASYDEPLPRYTSYPTALHFDDDVGADRIAAQLSAPEPVEDPDPVSLYIHVPFCKKLCWYCACTRIIEKNNDVAGPYVDALIEEMADKKRWIGQRPVVQIHFGGGTPTFLPPDEIRRLMGALRETFDVSDDAEISVEIDPRSSDADKIRALEQTGFNRASLGVQDHDPDVQEAIRRHQPYELTRQTVQRLREAGFESINFDLIYGLPNQTGDTFADTLDDLIELSPDRLAVYSYAHVPQKSPAQKHLERAGLPGTQTKFDILTHTVQRLTDAGLIYIGMDHFAAPDDSLTEAFRAGRLRRNFQGYSTHRDTEIFALGVSGISQASGCYFQNEKQLDAYYEAIEDEDQTLPVARGYELTADDQRRRETIMEVMCRPRVSIEAMSERLGVDFRSYFDDALARLRQLQDDDLVEVTDDELVIRPLGRLFLRHIASAFDAYLEPNDGRYSSAV